MAPPGPAPLLLRSSYAIPGVLINAAIVIIFVVDVLQVVFPVAILMTVMFDMVNMLVLLLPLLVLLMHYISDFRISESGRHAVPPR